ncbi:hypothetical protein [Mesorhizobium sp. GR13]|uniref:hypothetical protein n=1 Tax=Mesorhizobium sp. GR13 TaxID=2562308 RepID=UPI001485A09B|nr:hypothetical protein [Mesorhizobium sp. GR13]
MALSLGCVESVYLKASALFCILPRKARIEFKDCCALLELVIQCCGIIRCRRALSIIAAAKIILIPSGQNGQMGQNPESAGFEGSFLLGEARYFACAACSVRFVPFVPTAFRPFCGL